MYGVGNYIIQECMSNQVLTAKCKMHRPRRLKIADLNPHLICVLCGGYYVDATTIIECLHSFCKACIVRYLETNKYCPICDVQVHKTKPLQNIRSDQTLQDIVYKLVPGLFQTEMRYRREYYARHPDAVPSSHSDAGVNSEHTHIYTPDEPISLTLEYFRFDKSEENYSTKRYFRCPAAVTIAHLQKLIRAKYGLSSEYRIDIMHMDDPLNEEFTLMDVAYIYRWRRKGALDLTYRIFENCHLSNKRLKLDYSPCRNQATEQVKDGDNTVNKTEAMNVDVEPKKDKLDITQVKGVTAKEENNNKGVQSWKEVQLQISENGVMSVTDISIENNNNTVSNRIQSSVDSLKCSISHYIEDKPKYSEFQKKPELTLPQNDTEFYKSDITEKIIIPVTVSVTTTTVTNTIDAITSGTASTTVTSTTAAKTSTGSKSKEVRKASVENVSKSLAINTGVLETSTYSKQSDQLSSGHSTVQPVVLSSGITSMAESSLSKKIIENNNKNLKSGCPISDSQNFGTGSHLKHFNVSQSQITNKSSQPLVASTGKDVSRMKDGVVGIAKKEAPKIGIVAPTQSMIANPMVNKKPINSSSSSSPIGYKTLKTPPKSWNQNITRLSFLSSAKSHAFIANTSCDGRRSRNQTDKEVDSSGNTSCLSSKPVSSTNNAVPAKPNRFFKMRNMPRYLGNPASGVKPLYQVASPKKQDLGTQTMTQTSTSKPVYQITPGTSQQSSSSSSSKPLYNLTSTLSTSTSNLKPVVSAYHVGNQDCNNSTLSTSEVKTSLRSVPVLNQQLCNKIQAVSTSLSSATYCTSSPSTCSHSSGSNTSSNNKFQGACSKQETVMLGKSSHQSGVTNKQQDTTVSLTSKHTGVTLMKIDPKTLSPILVGSSSALSPRPLSPSSQTSSSSSQPALTSQNIKPYPLPAHTSPNRGNASPHNPLNSPYLPGLLYSSFPFPGMGVGVSSNRLGTGPPPLVRAGSLGAFHPLPPSINMLFNPHHRTHTHSSTATSAQPGVVPPPAVQRIPATNSQHKNNCGSGKPSVCSATPLPQSTSQHKTMDEKIINSLTGRTVNGEQCSEELVDRITMESCKSSSGDEEKEQGEMVRENLVEQGIASVSNLSSKNKAVSCNSESEQKTVSGKRESGNVKQNQTKVKQDMKETGKNEGNDSTDAVHVNKQSEKT